MDKLAMETCIKRLSQTSSSLDKISILDDYRENDVVKSIFKLCYDPYILSNIKKFKTSITGTKTVQDAFQEFNKLLSNLNDRNITGNDARDAVEEFLEDCTKEAQEVFSKVLKKDMKVGVSITTLNKVWDNLIEKFEVQLANKYDPEKDYDTDYFWASPKLDGLRAFFFKKDDQWHFMTRSGKEIIGFTHIIMELTVIAECYNLDFIDGELYSHDIPFQTIQGYILSYVNVDENNKRKIKMNVFAIGRKDFKNTDRMVEVINSISKLNFVEFVEYKKVVNNKALIESLATKYVEKGYEGIMLRNPYTYYSLGRSDDLLKFKFFKEEDFKIIGFQEGSVGSKYEGMLGAIIVEGVAEGKKIISDVGSGLSDEQREEIWENSSKYLNKIIEVKYQNITDKPNEDGVYSLRFPTVKAFKEDR
jgi:ATP-dependent DNA ligase